MNLAQDNIELRSEVTRLRQLLEHHGLLCDPAACSLDIATATVTEPLTAPLLDSACLRCSVADDGIAPPQRDSSAAVAGGSAGFEASHGLSKAQVERYSRQLLLPSFGLAAQEGVCSSSVLIVGCGGLGSPAALYLAAAGIGGCQASALFRDQSRSLSSALSVVLISSLSTVYASPNGIYPSSPPTQASSVWWITMSSRPPTCTGRSFTPRPTLACTRHCQPGLPAWHLTLPWTCKSTSRA